MHNMHAQVYIHMCSVCDTVMVIVSKKCSSSLLIPWVKYQRSCDCCLHSILEQ